MRPFAHRRRRPDQRGYIWWELWWNWIYAKLTPINSCWAFSRKAIKTTGIGKLAVQGSNKCFSEGSLIQLTLPFFCVNQCYSRVTPLPANSHDSAFLNNNPFCIGYFIRHTLPQSCMLLISLYCFIILRFSGSVRLFSYGWVLWQLSGTASSLRLWMVSSTAQCQRCVLCPSQFVFVHLFVAHRFHLILAPIVCCLPKSPHILRMCSLLILYRYFVSYLHHMHQQVIWLYGSADTKPGACSKRKNRDYDKRRIELVYVLRSYVVISKCKQLVCNTSRNVLLVAQC